MRKTTLLLSLLWIAWGAIAQSFDQGFSTTQINLPQSPTAAAFQQYIDMPVSHYTGVPNITIPIESMGGRHHAVNVSLRYHAGGHKVRQIATWVGLGWSLYTGGSVTRRINGYPDDLDVLGFIDYRDASSVSAINTLITNDDQAALDDLIKCRDVLPDIFQFDINGISGSFMFPWDSAAPLVVSCNQPVQISYTQAATGLIETIQIIGPDGMVYDFGIAEQTTAYSSGFCLGSSYTYASAWYLTKISHPYYPQEYTTYTYDTMSLQRDYEITEVGYYADDCGLVEIYTDPLTLSRSTSPEISTPRIRSISSFPSGRVLEFVPGAARSDDDGLTSTSNFNLLDKITLKRSGSELKYYDLVHDHSTGRLTLKQLQEKSSATSIPAYEFSYDLTHSLPPINSKQVDHWNFYNGSTNSLLPMHLYINEGVPVFFEGSNREPSLAHTQAGILTKVTYPTGGYTAYDYELNDYAFINDKTLPEAGLEEFTTVAFTRDLSEGLSGDTTFTISEPTALNFHIDVTVTTEPSNSYPANLPLVTLNNLTESTVVPTVYSNFYNQIFENTADYAIDTIFDFFTVVEPGTYKITFEVPEVNGMLIPNNTLDATLCYAEGLMSAPLERNTGGLRIKTITSYDANGQTLKKSLKYMESLLPLSKSSGVIYGEPHYVDYRRQLRLDGGNPAMVMECPYYNLLGADQVILGATQGQHVAYSRVIEYSDDNGDNGHTIYDFTSPLDYPDEILLRAPYSPPVENGYKTGMTKRIQYYDTNGVLVKKDTFRHEYIEQNIPVIKVSYGQLDKPSDLNSSTEVDYYYDTVGIEKRFSWEEFDIRIGHTVNYPIAETYYYPEGNITSTFDRQYDAALQLLHYDEMMNSDERIYRHQYDYTLDGAVGDSLEGHNIYLPAKSMITLVGDSVFTPIGVNLDTVSGYQSSYSFIDASGLPTASATSQVLPHTISKYEVTWIDDVRTFKSGGPWQLHSTIESYQANTSYPTALQVDGWSDPSTYIWTSSGKIEQWSYKDYSKHYSYFSGNDLLESFTDIDSTQSTFTYDALLRMESSTNCTGVEVSIAYNYGTGTALNNITTTTNYDDFGTATNIDIINVGYFDGLGRSVQSLAYLQNPINSSISIATQQAYDAYGRMTTAFEPIASLGTPTNYIKVTQQDSTLTTFEASPLNRPVSSTPPSWYATTMSYGTNTATDAVKNHETGVNYAAGTLHKQVTIDPEGQASEIYTDKRGRQILSRVKASATTTNTAEIADTYTLYDDKDRPTLIIPPDAELTDTGLLFEMVYAADDHVIIQDNPDQEPIQMVYDDRDLMTYRQDGNMDDDNHWYAYAYDDYGRTITEGFAADSISSITEVLIQNTFGTTTAEKGKLKTASQKVLNGSDITLSQEYIYDDCGRNTLIKSNSILHPTPGSIVDSLILDSRDMAIESYQKVIPDGLTIKRRQTYDHAGREKKAFIQITTPEQTWPEKELSEMSYTVKEQISALKLGGSLQEVNYGYRANGMLTAINQAYNSFSTSGDLFALLIGYDSSLDAGFSGLQLKKDGNISHVQWSYKTATGSTVNKNRYRYQYDFLKRLTTAYDQSQSGNNRYTTTYTYKDHRGNFNTVSRMSPSGMIDNLNYNYYSGTNKIKSISDGSSAPFQKKGYKANTSMDYEWDGNGTITGDPSRSSYFTNNHLNLPDLISVPDSSFVMQYYYDAQGTLWRTEEYRNDVLQNYRDYIGSTEYYNGVFDQHHTDHATIELNYSVPDQLMRTGIEVDTTKQAIAINSDAAVQSPTVTIYEGGEYIWLRPGFEVSLGADFTARIDTFPVTGFTALYHISDHVGNRRVLFSDLSDDGQIQSSEILGNYNNYPFGMPLEDGSTDYTDRFRYLSKGHELLTGLGLNYRRTLNRFYDSGAGIWYATDPLQNAPENIGFSSYATMWNNPVLYSDENGDCPDCEDTLDLWGQISNAISGFWQSLGFRNDEIPSTSTTIAYAEDLGERLETTYDVIFGIVPGSASLKSAATGEVDGVGIAGDIVSIFPGIGLLDDAGKGALKFVDDFVLLHGDDLIKNSESYKIISKLSDNDLIQSVLNPFDKRETIKLNTVTGNVSNGNTRLYELKRRGINIKIPYEDYTPDRSMFVDP